MSKTETIKRIVCDTIAASDGADWATIKDAISARYTIKDWVKEVRNPIQSLIAMDVIERTDNVFKEVFVFTATSKSIMASMAA